MNENMNEPLVVQAQVQVVTAQVVVKEEEHSLLPYPDETKWHTSECDRCCTCTGDCWLAWCCSCFSLGHIASKLEALGQPYCLTYWHIVGIAIAFFILDTILQNSIVNFDFSFLRIFLIVVIFQLRGLVRQRLNIPGDCCSDCLWSFFCGPCVITQINGTLWKQPEIQPGCSCEDQFAKIV
mmetsp:Transcript_10159/g.12325  ORF Transcript_10159/g.12325 Transcript_10159/m.12325 type:complete len:181 (+) Transcript_10159:55-597(+)